MIRSRIVLTFLFSILLPHEAIAASQSNVLAREQEENVHTQAEEQLEMCAICRDDMAPSPQQLTIKVIQDVAQDVEALQKKYQARVQQLTEILTNSTTPEDQEAICQEIETATESYETALQKEKAAGEMVRELGHKIFLKTFSQAQTLSEDRLRQLNQRRCDPAVSDEEKGALDAQIKPEETHYRAILKYRQHFSSPETDQNELSGTLRAFLAEPGVTQLYGQSMSQCLIQSFLEEAREVLLECGHRYHLRCLTSYLKLQCIVSQQPELIRSTCPTCRAPLSENDSASLDLEITLDDLLSFFANRIRVHLTLKHIRILIGLGEHLGQPQTALDLERIFDLSKDEIQELISKVKAFTRRLEADFGHTEDLHGLIAEFWPSYSKAQFTDALYRVIDYFEITEGRLRGFIEWAAAEYNIPVGLVADDIVASIKLLRMPHPQPMDDNPLARLERPLRQVDPHSLLSFGFSLAVPLLLAHSGEIYHSVQQALPPQRLELLAYAFLQSVEAFNRIDTIPPFIQHLIQAISRLHLHDVQFTADTLATLVLSNNRRDRLSGALRSLIIQNNLLAQVQTIVEDYGDYHQQNIDRLREDTRRSLFICRPDRGHIALLGIAIILCWLNLYQYDTTPFVGSQMCV